MLKYRQLQEIEAPEPGALPLHPTGAKPPPDYYIGSLYRASHVQWQLMFLTTSSARNVRITQEILHNFSDQDMLIISGGHSSLRTYALNNAHRKLTSGK